MVKQKNYKKYFKKKKILLNEKKNLCFLKKGVFGIKAITSGVITPFQLEVIRRIISRITKRIGKIYMNINFYQALTKKPLLTRMGKGCGNIYIWISYIKKGKIILELNGINEKKSKIILNSIKHRVPLKLELIKREIFDLKE